MQLPDSVLVRPFPDVRDVGRPGERAHRWMKMKKKREEEVDAAGHHASMPAWGAFGSDTFGFSDVCMAT